MNRFFHFLLWCLLGIVSATGFAQSKGDLRRTEIPSKRMADTVQAWKLLASTWQVAVDPQKPEAEQSRIKNAEKALDMFVAGKSTKGMIKSLEWLARIYIDLNQPDEAINFARQAVNVAEKSRPQDRAYTLLTLGESIRFKGGCEETLRIYRQGLALLDQKREEELWRRYQFHIGLNYQTYCKDYPAAIGFYLQAIKAGNVPIKIHILNYAYKNLGLCYMLTGDYTQAFSYLERSKAYCESKKDYKALIDVYHGLAWSYRRTNQPKQAVTYYGKALEVARISKNQALEKECLAALGHMANARSNYAEAIALNLELAKLAEATHDETLLNAANSGLGLSYISLHDYKKALEFYKKNLRIYEKQGNKTEISNTYSNLAMAYQGVGDLNSASGMLVRSLEYSTNSDTRMHVLNNLGMLYLEQGRYDEAEKSLTEPVEFYKKQEIPSMPGLAFHSLGELYLKKSSDPKIDPIEQKEALNQGILLLEQASSEYQKFGVKDNYQLAQSQLADAYVRQGDYSKAYSSQKKHYLYKDSIFNQDNIRKIANLENKYIYEKREDSLQFIGRQQQLGVLRQMQLNSLRHEYEFKQAKAKSEKERLVLRQEEALKREQIEKAFAIKDAQNKLQKAQLIARQNKDKLDLEREKNIRNLYLGGLLLALGLGGLLIYQNRIRKRNNFKLNKLNQELAEANKVKARFMGILGHDFRSPLSNILNYLNLDSGDKLAQPDKNRFRDQTTSAARELLNSMDTVLFWSKGQMDRFIPEKETVHVPELFEELGQQYHAYHHIAMFFESPDDAVLVTDENCLKTILRNLTLNAIKALANQPDPQIHWKAWTTASSILLSITDNGPGGNSADFRALYDDNHEIGFSAGLGLHLIRDLADVINCTVRVDLEHSQGVQITMELPKL